MSTAKTVVSFDMFDTTTKADAGFEVPILKTDGEESGLFITVLGTDSATFRKIKEKNERAHMRLLSKGGKFISDVLYDSAKATEFENVADCTIAWRSTAGEMPFDVSDKDRLVEFYAKYPVVFEQVGRAMGDRANFTKT